ncbi:unnamed protein product [Rotaria sp. Silwood1]|nr:unnamed protein product [Rotaria sp. Silwood1]CAF4000607.1 unnamed protein product [Rotaria sp. Silwood1]CAF4966312.1 unnamed protein product [Rotaria sp. Silwood1]CAF4993024.1 unnamed protein product [Rotaria sp. Silwood1]
MYFQLFLHILLHLEVDNAKQDMFDVCHRQYDGNEYKLKNIEEFERNYTVDKVIQWYTCDTFLYRILNKALRIEDINMLFTLRYYIKDLFFQLKQFNEND